MRVLSGALLVVLLIVVAWGYAELRTDLSTLRAEYLAFEKAQWDQHHDCGINQTRTKRHLAWHYKIAEAADSTGWGE